MMAKLRAGLVTGDRAGKLLVLLTSLYHVLQPVHPATPLSNTFLRQVCLAHVNCF